MAYTTLDSTERDCYRRRNSSDCGVDAPERNRATSPAGEQVKRVSPSPLLLQGRPEGLDPAIPSAERVLANTPEGDPALLYRVSNLATLLSFRFERLGAWEDIDRSMSSPPELHISPRVWAKTIQPGWQRRCCEAGATNLLALSEAGEHD
jgi:hypothetical protein